MDVETAIRTRRTHKVFTDEPLTRGQIGELLDLANWAPNHHLTVPWQFRVVGPAALARLGEAAGPEGAAKLERCPTLVVVSAQLDGGDEVERAEDVQATAVAAYIVLLAAHARGLAGYWRTPDLLRTEAGRAAVGLPDTEEVVGLLHLGHLRQEMPAPDRPGAEDTVVYLD
jgi:nitroreductase